jgi:MraZ protein
VLSQGSPDRCLRVYTLDSFASEAAKTVAQPAQRRSGRVLRKSLFARSFDAELDKQNRLLIPAPMRAYARLSGKVLVVGAGECLEIWSPEEYEEEMTRVDAELEETLESVPTWEQ